jgi:hypothetical protein
MKIYHFAYFKKFSNVSGFSNTSILHVYSIESQFMETLTSNLVDFRFEHLLHSYGLSIELQL